MNVNTVSIDFEIDTSELASELVYESEFTSGVASVMQDELPNYVGDEVDRYMSDHIEDVVIDVMKSNPDLIRGLVAEAMLSIMQDNITY